MTICYLDPEDEITGAVARIRAVEDEAAILVLPPNSRIATSRINFRLLGREAGQKGIDLIAVSDEPGVRALAISAGVPAYDSIAAAEKGLAEFARQDERLAARTGEQATRPAAPVPAAHPRDDSEGTRVMALPRGLDGPAGGDRDEAYPAAADRSERWARRRRRSRLFPILAVVLAVALIGVAAYGAYLFVPTATITVRPQLVPVGPVSGAVIADPRVTVIDPGEGVVPAQVLHLPLSVSGQFDSSGTQVTTTRATGEVRFRSTNTVNEIEVPAGTRVSTAANVQFETTAQVTVPRADFDSQTPSTADVPIRARRAGEVGNVAARSITGLPAGLAEQQLTVTNPERTSGGARLAVKVVASEDYDAALEALNADLSAELAQALLEPGLASAGLTVFTESATLGGADASDPAGALVGTVADSFSLSLTAEATVLAVDEAHVDDVAREQLRALVPAGSTLLEGSLEVNHAPGEIEGGVISFVASADGSAYRLPDRAALLEEIRGKSATEARAIMETYGNVELSIWPDFVDRVPDQPSRINLTIQPPTETT